MAVALDIIFAEDELVFREISIPSLLKSGVAEDKLHVAEDGAQALEHLNRLQSLDASDPVLMLLDVRMPVMDGKQCATKVKDMIASKSLQRVPVLACCSAGNRGISFDDPEGLFQIILPKPFGKKELQICLEKVQEFSGGATGTPAARVSSGSGGGSGGFADAASFLEKLRVIIADDEPICRMAYQASLTAIGAKDSQIMEAEELDETQDTIRDALKEDVKSPLIIMVGNTTWIPELKSTDTKNAPFIVCTSVDVDVLPSGAADASLQRQFQTADLKKVLEECRAWFNKRLS